MSDARPIARAAPTPPANVPTVDRHSAVVHLTAECWPFARTGGLGEAVSTLARFQAASGYAVAVVMPLYRVVREMCPVVTPVGPAFAVELDGRSHRGQVFQPGISADDGARAAQIFFVDLPEAFDRAGLYGEGGVDYPDNGWRFALLCRAALAALPWLVPEAHVLHVHDWHAALGPVYLRTDWASSPFHRRLATVLSVHNAGYHGCVGPEMLARLGLPARLYDWRLLEWYGQVNLLKGGLAFADAVTTVSPTHARELCTPAGGFGLHGAFSALGDRLVGITNGIDQEVWDPARDPHIAGRYDAADPSGKRRCKTALQRAFGLPIAPAAPVIAVCARLVEQKGLDLLLEADIPGGTAAQLVILGEGEPRYAHALASLAAAVPDRVAVQLSFRDHLEHVLLAGADLVLLPSRYEPCGLTQMRAQRYGTIPVARRVGGLADTIEDGVTGIFFDEPTPGALLAAVRRALALHADPVGWARTVRAAMGRDFGWHQSVTAYGATYERARSRHAGTPHATTPDAP